jgi:signal transduction histidine kinase
VPKRLLLALADPNLSNQVANQVFAPAGFGVTRVHEANAVRSALRGNKRHDLIFLEDPITGEDTFSLAAEIHTSFPAMPVVIVAEQVSNTKLLLGLQVGAVDVLSLPLDNKAALNAAQRSLERKRQWEGWVKRETGRITGPLNQRLSEMEAILRQVTDGVLVLDKQKHVLMVNQALRNTFALGDGNFTGKPVGEVLNNPALLDAVADSAPEDGRYEVQNEAGRVFHVRISRVPEVGTVASLHDISYLKELDRMKGDFVNTVSHDLRSPLTAILGYVELIERAGQVNSQQAEFIKRVKNSVHTTTSLIDDLLKLARAEVGSLDEMTPVDMKLLVANSLAALQPEVQAKRQTLRLRRSDDLPTVIGSRTQLRQLVDNLIGNAVKYTPVGGQLRVMMNQEQNQLILHVADNGPGIPLEDQSRIFEKFYRASNVENGVPGTGLGLAIVKTIVDNHRGRIWVESKPGEGSVFTVVLPLTKERLPLVEPRA